MQPLQPSQPILPETMNSSKFMDDATIQETVDINSSVCSNIDRSGPLPFHESSGKILPGENSMLQQELNNIKLMSDNREMLLNTKKTVLFVSNFTEIHQFRPIITIPGENIPLTVVQDTKLLGYWLTGDMKPKKHVKYIISKAHKRIWIMRRLKIAKCNNSDMVHIYIALIRSILETACPVFHSQLTIEDSNDIERIQKIFIWIVLGSRYEDYNEACIQLKLQPLKLRRENLCLDFALKCLSDKNHSNMFTRNPVTRYSTRNHLSFLEPNCATKRYQESPLPYLTKLLNNYFEENS